VLVMLLKATCNVHARVEEMVKAWEGEVYWNIYML
jgi:hypothetical protein